MVADIRRSILAMLIMQTISDMAYNTIESASLDRIKHRKKNQVQTSAPAFREFKQSSPTRIISWKTGMGSRRFELLTSAMSRRRHNQLDHEPAIDRMRLKGT